MIQIQDNQIIRDGVDIGQIEDGTAYVTEKQPPRVVGQIRAAAGNPALVISVRAEAPKSSQTITGCNAEMAAEMPVPGAATEPSPGEAPIADEQPEEIGVTVEVEKYEDTPAPQAAPESVKPGRIYDLTGFPDYASDPRMFAKCFINNYGPDAFTEWQKANA